ncbi:MAG TPA: hypothetical protein DEF61_03045 [Firmicutes bacterium]|nr:hypothetical protein [Bacillota bacterium]HBX25234.1 hypothetical protein [Bacillota bacterium]
MYKIVFVDDEEGVRERALMMLAKLSSDFSVVGVFQNGYDALLNIPSLEPDIVITDIKMPFISGIELIKEVKIDLPLTQFIILSGYDSFDYAKEAITLGVNEYLTKPLVYEELKDALIKVKETLDKQIQNERDISFLKERVQYSLRLLQNEDLQKLITIKDMRENFKEKLEKDKLDLSYPFQLLLIIDSDMEDPPYEQLDFLHLSTRQIFEEAFTGKIQFYSFLYDEQFVALLLSNDKFDEQSLSRKINELLAKIKRNTSLSVSAGLSECVEGMVNYRKVYRHAKRALEFRTVMGGGSVLSFTDLERNESGEIIGKVDENEYKNISYLLSYGKQENALASIDKLISSISDPSFKDSYYFILLNLMDSILKSCISLKELYSRFNSQIELTQELYSLKTKQATINFFHSLATKVMEINKEKRMEGLESSFDRIKKYIEANYANSNLSIVDLANELSFSISYITTILKRNGTTFTKMVTKERMENAFHLLNSTDERIVSIAKEVGYSDPYYFSHCFKKFYKVSPDEFRKNKENK